jgi:hypothetical protein
MKKIRNESGLVKEALRVGLIYAERRGAAEFENTDSSKAKVQFIYRLLVHDKLIQPVPPDQESEPIMKHKLALWISKQLPEDHPLLK